MRKQPDVKLAEIIGGHLDKGKQPAGTVTWTRKYKLITPLFGGGVSPMECDPVTIIRGTEIRAHLRFWWRATRGGCYGDLSKMKEAEAKIWGAAHISKKNTTPSEKKDDELALPTVQIEVTVNKDTIKDGSPVFAYDRDWSGKIKRDDKKRPIIKQIDQSIPAYAAFPLRPTDEEREKERNAFKAGHEGEGIVFKKVRKDVEFTLTITFAKDYEQEIRAALWAWETFGGIGARTRRGFGAIYCADTLPGIKPLDKLPTAKIETRIKEIKIWIQGNLDAFISAEDKFPDNVPHLSRHLRPALIPPSINKEPKRQNSYTEQQKLPTINDAWIELVKQLKSFRQPMDKQHTWPDGENARDIVNNVSREKPAKFPKANIGLPIVFQDEDGESITLKGAEEGKDRFASPLILRPAFFLKEPFGIALLLEGTDIYTEQTEKRRSGPLQLTKKEKTYPTDSSMLTHPKHTTLTKREADEIAVLKGNNKDSLGKTEILDALFSRYENKRGGTAK